MSTVTIGGTEYELRPLTADAALRIMDIVAAATDDLQTSLDAAQQWRAEYIDRNSFIVDMGSFEIPDLAGRLSAAGITPEMVQESGSVRLVVEPEELEMFAAVLPGAWRSLRDPILDACVVILAPTDELLDAEDDGSLEEYMHEWKRKIRSEATPEELADLLWEMFQHTREQLLGQGGAVGKLLARLGGMGILGSKESAPKKTPAKRASKSSTPSARRTTGGAAKSSSPRGGRSDATSS